MYDPLASQFNKDVSNYVPATAQSTTVDEVVPRTIERTVDGKKKILFNPDFLDLVGNGTVAFGALPPGAVNADGNRMNNLGYQGGTTLDDSFTSVHWLGDDVGISQEYGVTIDANNDADNDGVCGDVDLCEGYDDALDADADGTPDGCDLCADANDSLDADSDGTPDACDADLLLHEGNNLVSFVALPSDLSLSSVFAGSDLAGVIGEGSAAAEIGGSWYGSLNTIDALSGYWVQANSDQEIDVVGTASDDLLYTLHDANNLISYPYAQSQSIADALPNDVEDEVFAIVGEGVASINLNGIWLGSLGSLSGGKGYWFARSADASDLTFQYNSPSAGSSARLLSGDLPKVPEAYAYTQSTEQGFYFIESVLIDGEPMAENNWIVAYNNDVVVGARMWTGEYTDIPAMGNDSSTQTAGYMEMGNIPTFKLMDSVTGEMLDLYVDGTIDPWTNNGVSVITLSTTPELPTAVTLNGSYPNPFNPATTISFSIPSEMNVDVKVYDISGRMVGELMNGIQSQGLYEITWDASSQASGLYFVRLVAGTEMHTQKIMLVK